MVSQAYPTGAAELLTSSFARRPHVVPTAAAAMHHYRRAPVPAASPLQMMTLPLRHQPPTMLAADPAQPKQRSPLLCGYPSKKCWSWRVEKRNGELHKFCEYHRQKANTNQRRMEQRRKLGQGKPRGARPTSTSTSASSDIASANTNAGALKVECATAPMAVKAEPVVSGSPRGVDLFDGGASAASMSAVADVTAAYSWMDVELDVGLDAAVEYMLFDPAAIDMEPSDKPVDLYEEDLFFLEHFIDEIAHSAM